MELLFGALVVAYFALGTKLDEWTTCVLLCMRSATPEYYLRAPKAYKSARILIFFSALASLLASQVPWYLGVAVLVGAWLGTTWFGQRMAFNLIRERARQMMEFAESDSDRAEFSLGVQKSNSELREMISRMNMFGK